jgi:peptidoglycan hydrolase-like protein with peptidoglycan-binding domain
MSRGFFNSETTGVYDQATIDAMRRFQANQKIPITGYPTAHALKRLGLAN